MPNNAALYLRGACLNGVAARTQISVGPRAFINCMAVRAFQLSIGAKQFLGYLLEALVQFAPKDFLYRPFWAWNSGCADAAEGAHLVESHDLDLSITLGQIGRASCRERVYRSVL